MIENEWEGIGTEAFWRQPLVDLVGIALNVTLT